MACQLIASLNFTSPQTELKHPVSLGVTCGQHFNFLKAGIPATIYKYLGVGTNPYIGRKFLPPPGIEPAPLYIVGVQNILS